MLAEVADAGIPVRGVAELAAQVVERAAEGTVRYTNTSAAMVVPDGSSGLCSIPVTRDPCPTMTTSFCADWVRDTSVVTTVQSEPRSRWAATTGRRSRAHTWSVLVTTTASAPNRRTESAYRERSSPLPSEKPS